MKQKITLPKDEEFALKTLSAHLSGTFMPGEDPPDGYISVAEKKYAVEVTRLIEPSVHPEKGHIPRLADDVPAERMGDRIAKIFDARCIFRLNVNSHSGGT
ncbi:MAG: hypothetical protein V3U76_04100 [Granulosicoccus sp.]